MEVSYKRAVEILEEIQNDKLLYFRLKDRCLNENRSPIAIIRTWGHPKYWEVFYDRSNEK